MTNPFSCEVRHAYHLVSRSWSAQVSLRLDATDEVRAFLQEVPEKVWRTLCVVALRMESAGRCFVTDADIANDMAITKAQAAKRLKELSEWEYKGGKVLVADGEGYSLTPICANPSLLCDVSVEAEAEKERPLAEPPKDEIPTTQDLIRELTRKLHEIPGVQAQRGNYSLIGRALNTYGYEAVSEALDDLLYEFDLREDLGQAIPTNGELGRLLMQRAAWNVRRLDSQAAQRGGSAENLWDYYGWNDQGDQLVPVKPDPPFTATVIGGQIVIGPKQREVEI